MSAAPLHRACPQDLLVRHHAEPLPALLERLLADYASFRERDHDDVTVVLLRRRA